jgi:hypothetical protein
MGGGPNRGEASYSQPWIDFLEESIGKHLGHPVRVDDRAAQAMAVMTRHQTRPNMTHVWAALAQTWPALWRMYAAIGYDPRVHHPLPSVLQRIDLSNDHWQELDWDSTHGGIFGHPSGRPGPITPAASEVVRLGRLSAADLATSILEFENGDHRKALTNPVVRHLARASGLGRHVRLGPEVVQFRAEAVNILASTARLDARNGDQQFLLYHDGSAVKIRPYGAFGIHVPEDESTPAARVNVIQPAGIFGRLELEEFEGLINSDARESAFQEFLERHPHFILATGPYLRAHAHVAMLDGHGTKLIPDFFLERSDRALADICDLKRANVELVRHQRNRERFSGAIHEAVAQLTHYRDFFERAENRSAFKRANPHLDAYRPRVVIVVGRRSSFEDDLQRVRLESSLPGYVDLRTYDDVLTAATKWRRFVASTAIKS